MSFSISPSTPFTSINWDTFENRPVINKSMKFCEEKDWYADTKCCMDGYSIEHVLDVAHENNLWNAPEVQFLDEYPCVNGLELDSLADKIAGMIPDTEPEPTPTPTAPKQCLPIIIFEQLKKLVCLE